MSPLPVELPRAFRDLHFEMMPAPSLFRDAINKRRRPVFTNDGQTTTCPRRSALPRSAGYQTRRRRTNSSSMVRSQVCWCCLNSGRGGFTVEDMASLQRLADHTALALHSARLVRSAEEAAQNAQSCMRQTLRVKVCSYGCLRARRQVLANALTRDELYGGLTRINRRRVRAALVAASTTPTPFVELLVSNFKVGVSARCTASMSSAGISGSRALDMLWIPAIPLVCRRHLHASSNERPNCSSTNRCVGKALAPLPPLPLLLGRSCARGVLAIRYRGDARVLTNAGMSSWLVSFATQIAVAQRQVGYIADLEIRAERSRGAGAGAAATHASSCHATHLMPAIVAAVAQVVPASRCDLFFPSAGTLQVRVRDGRRQECTR